MTPPGRLTASEGECAHFLIMEASERLEAGEQGQHFQQQFQGDEASRGRGGGRVHGSHCSGALCLSRTRAEADPVRLRRTWAGRPWSSARGGAHTGRSGPGSAAPRGGRPGLGGGVCLRNKPRLGSAPSAAGAAERARRPEDPGPERGGPQRGPHWPSFPQKLMKDR